MWSNEDNWGQIDWGILRSNEVKCGRIKSNQVKLGLMRSTEVNWGQLRSNEVNWGKMRSNDVNWGQINEVKLDKLRSNLVKWDHFWFKYHFFEIKMLNFESLNHEGRIRSIKTWPFGYREVTFDEISADWNFGIFCHFEIINFFF